MSQGRTPVPCDKFEANAFSRKESAMDNPVDVFSNRNLIAPNRKEWLWSILAWVLFMGGFSLLMPLLGFHTTTEQGRYTFQFAHELFSFLTVLIVFHRFLYRSRCKILRLLTTALLGYLALNGISYFWQLLLSFIPIPLNNLNQESVEASIHYEPLTMAFQIIVMAPIVEETLIRGSIFAPLCKKSPLLAYIASMSVFSFLHIVSSIGSQSPAELLRSFLEYLPGGFMMSWAYQRTGTIWGSVTLHSFCNLVSMFFILRG